VTKRERPVDADFGELYKARQVMIQARLACDQAVAVLNRLTVTEARRGSVVGIENVGTVDEIMDSTTAGSIVSTGHQSP
jgi:hypothetical protein